MDCIHSHFYSSSNFNLQFCFEPTKQENSFLSLALELINYNSYGKNYYLNFWYSYKYEFINLYTSFRPIILAKLFFPPN